MNYLVRVYNSKNEIITSYVIHCRTENEATKEAEHDIQISAYEDYFDWTLELAEEQ